VLRQNSAQQWDSYVVPQNVFLVFKLNLIISLCCFSGLIVFCQSQITNVHRTLLVIKQINQTLPFLSLLSFDFRGCV